MVNDPLYNHKVFGPLKGRGGDIGGKTDEQLILDLINIHNAENWLGIDDDADVGGIFKTASSSLTSSKLVKNGGEYNKMTNLLFDAAYCLIFINQPSVLLKAAGSIHDEYEECEEAVSRETSSPTPSGQLDNCLGERKPEEEGHQLPNREPSDQEQSSLGVDEDNISNNGNGVYYVSSSNLGNSSPSSSCPVKVLEKSYSALP